MLTKDNWQVILTRLSRYLRAENPKQWDALKRVSKTFRDVLWQIENNDKLVIYCNRPYPTSHTAVLQEQLDHALHQKAKKADLHLTFNTPHKIIAIKQLGRQPIHHWAPLLICDDKFQLHLCEINSHSTSLPTLCTYQQHQAKLTAAISLGDCVVTADAAGFVGIWQPRLNDTPVKISHFSAHDNAITAIDYLSQDFFVTCADTEVKYWKINQTEPVKTLNMYGTVKDIRVRSIDEFVILTHTARRLQLTLHLNNSETQLLDYEMDAKSKMLVCDELRIVTTKRIIGVIDQIQKDCFHSVDASAPAPLETKPIVSRHQGLGFFSRAGFCGVYAKRPNEQTYDVILNLEPTTIAANALN